MTISPSSFSDLETLALKQDRRNATVLLGLVKKIIPSCTYEHAGDILLNSASILITTGFRIQAKSSGKFIPETDGPLGAVLLADILLSLGKRVAYIADQPTIGILQHMRSNHICIEFPIADIETSCENRDKILETMQPDTIVAIERPGLTKDNTYRTMHGVNVTKYHSIIDVFFDPSCGLKRIGVADGGNEIGCGIINQNSIEEKVGIPYASKTSCDYLLVSAVSNRAIPVLAIALSQKSGKELVPLSEQYAQELGSSVEVGAIDGVSGQPTATNDGFPIEDDIAFVKECLELYTKLSGK